MLTNAFVPCNGRFPTLVALSAVFLSFGSPYASSLLVSAILAGMIILSIFTTLLASKLLSRTVLRGEASSFCLELPPYRKPQIGRVIVRSISERTVCVLGRAVAVAAPAGLILWILANVSCGEVILLMRLSEWLNPIGRWFGVDGVILLAFILALPANEIVIPVMLMAYTSSGMLTEYENLAALRDILTTNGWTLCTVLCVLCLMLFHYPCATALWTLRRESGSWRWTLLGAVLPTAVGLLLCLGICGIFKWAS